MKAETEKLLNKAARAIQAAQILLREGEVDFAAGRAYYAMFYVAEAVLVARSGVAGQRWAWLAGGPRGVTEAPAASAMNLAIFC